MIPQDKVRYLPWLASEFEITPFAAVVVMISLAVFMVGGGVSFSVLVQDDLSFGETVARTVMAFAGIGTIVSWPMVFAMGKARGNGAMAVIGFFVASSSLACTLGILLSGWLDGWVMAAIQLSQQVVCFAPAGLFGAIGAWEGARALRTGWPKAQGAALRSRLERTGWAGLDELSDLIDADEPTVIAFLDHGKPRGVMQDGIFWSLADRREKAGAAVKMLRARGRVHVRDLGRHLALRPAMVEHLVHHLSAQSTFTGWVDWKHGILVTAEASELEARGDCPRCGGDFRAEGRGMVACQHCGCEVYLPLTR